MTRTLLRFTHATREAGGMERYLADLNRALLERNPWTIIQLSLPRGIPGRATDQAMGRGRLIDIPMTERIVAAGPAHRRRKSTGAARLRGVARDLALSVPGADRLFLHRVARRRHSTFGREPADVEDRLREILASQQVDLMLVHTPGGSGGWQAIEQAREHGVPYALFNHYANDRYRGAAILGQLQHAVGAGGVSGEAVPSLLRRRFRNLSDGIDTGFFHPERATADAPDDPPVLVLPARVVPGKGHADLIRVVEALHKAGVPARAAFAGRMDDSQVVDQLRTLAQSVGVGDLITFAGSLSSDRLRELYASGAMVVLPSRSEGLGRVLLEAQAMARPVVAYGVGGVPEAVRPGETGFLVKPGSVRCLTDRVRILLEQPDRRAAMGRAGRAWVSEHFSLEALAARHEAWYESCLVQTT